MRGHLGEREPARERVPSGAAAAEADADRHAALRREPTRHQPRGPARPAHGIVDADALGETMEDLPVVQGTRWLGEQRLRVLHRVAHREQVEDDVEVVALQPRCRRQDEVRVTGGLVEVRIDRDHEIEPGQRLLELAAVRRREHRVAGGGDERTDPPLAGRQDLLGERRHRELAAELRQPAHARAALAERAGRTERPAQTDDVEGGPREHRAADPVEVACQDVQQLDQPLAQRAELLRRDAHAAVAHGRGRGREVADEPLHDLGIDARRGGRRLGRERAHQIADGIHAVDRA